MPVAVLDEVLRHVVETNKHNSDLMRQRLLKERQMTAMYLRKYYLQCLNQLLDKQFDS